MKLLLENWRQYLTEGSAIDDNLELLSSAAFDEEQLAALNQLGFDLVGRGAYRNVFSGDAAGYGDAVIKVAKEAPDDFSTPLEQNKLEGELGATGDYDDLLPKTIASHPEHRWIAVEAITTPFPKDRAQQLEILTRTFPQLFAAIEANNLSPKLKARTRGTFISKSSIPFVGLGWLLMGASKSAQTPFHWWGRSAEGLRALHAYAYENDANYRALFDLVASPEARLDIEDIFTSIDNFKSVGVGQDGKLKIVDLSLA
jgi:hypothetical protein